MRTVSDRERTDIVSGIISEIYRLENLPGGVVSSTYEVGADLKFDIELQRIACEVTEKYTVVGIVDGKDYEACVLYPYAEDKFREELLLLVRMCTYDV